MWQRMFNICSNYVENFFRVCLKSFQKLSNFRSKSAQNITNLSLISVENPINLPKCRRRITCKFRGFCSTNHTVITSELFFDDILDEELTIEWWLFSRARPPHLPSWGREGGLHHYYLAMTNTMDSCRRWTEQTSTFVTMCLSSIIFWDIQSRIKPIMSWPWNMG